MVDEPMFLLAGKQVLKPSTLVAAMKRTRNMKKLMVDSYIDSDGTPKLQIVIFDANNKIAEVLYGEENIVLGTVEEKQDG